MKTYVYIDGFNLYYGAIRGTKYKWLDVRSLLAKLLKPTDQIAQIRYFTALVRGSGDPQSPQRQQVYLRALRTIPHLSIHFGHFMSQKVWMKLVKPQGKQKFAHVIRFEEKGSDVNLATYMLVDGFTGAYQQAVVVSNDSDLLEPIKVVRSRLGLPVGLVTPHAKTSKTLKPHASFVKRIRTGPIAASQFPNPLTDANGTFTKPHTW